MGLLDRVLFVGAHTDDIELFAGGLTARLAREGTKQFWLTFSSHRGVTDHELAAREHRRNRHELGDALVQQTLLDLGAVDGSFQAKRQLLYDEILRKVRAIDATLVVTHPEDTNQDHLQVLLECRRALKGVVSLVSGEYPFNQLGAVLSNLFIEVDRADVAKKVTLIQQYQSQYAPHRHYFHAGVWEGLARVHGAQIGVPYAEAFHVERLGLR